MPKETGVRASLEKIGSFFGRKRACYNQLSARLVGVMAPVKSQNALWNCRLARSAQFREHTKHNPLRKHGQSHLQDFGDVGLYLVHSSTKAFAWSL